MRVPTTLRLHDWDDRNELFLCLLRIKFWVQILFSKSLDKSLPKSYNTTPAKEGMECCSLLRPHSCSSFSKLTTWFQLTFAMCCGIMSMEAFADPILDVASRHLHRWTARLLFCFSLLLFTSKWWPHIIFSDTDLTTFLTIVTSGVHGDKMLGEYEKVVFA